MLNRRNENDSNVIDCNYLYSGKLIFLRGGRIC
nr:MAG TPA: hypothetical protein [Caudoviricetes sp.]